MTPDWLQSPDPSNPRITLRWLVLIALMGIGLVFVPVAAFLLPWERLAIGPVFFAAAVLGMLGQRKGWGAWSIAPVLTVVFGRFCFASATGILHVWDGMTAIMVVMVLSTVLMVNARVGMAVGSLVVGALIWMMTHSPALAVEESLRVSFGYIVAYGLIGTVVALAARLRDRSVEQRRELGEALALAEHDTARSLAVNQALLAHLPDAFLVTGPDDCVTRCNGAASRLFGPAVGRCLTELHSSGETGEVALETTAGTRSVIADRRPFGDGMVWVFTDITARTESEDRAREAATRARESESRKSAFLANMSHELRTPLNAIVGYSELLLDEPRDPVQVNDLRRIAAAGRHLLNLIKQVLDLAKLQAGRMEVAFEQVEIPKLLGRLPPSMTVTLDFEPAPIRTDPERFCALARHLQEGAKSLGREARLRIHQDTGVLVLEMPLGRIGVDPNALLDPLGPAGRSGLMFALAARLAEALGGRLRTRTVGKRVTIVVFLPNLRPLDAAMWE